MAMIMSNRTHYKRMCSYSISYATTFIEMMNLSNLYILYAVAIQRKVKLLGFNVKVSRWNFSAFYYLENINKPNDNIVHQNNNKAIVDIDIDMDIH